MLFGKTSGLPMRSVCDAGTAAGGERHGSERYGNVMSRDNARHVGTHETWKRQIAVCVRGRLTRTATLY